MKKWAIGLFAFITIGAVIAIFAIKVGSSQTPDVLPTIAVLPTASTTSTPLTTPSPTATFTATATATNTPTATLTPTDTPTLATLVLQITADEAQVSATPSPMPSATVTPTMSPTYNVPSPPPQISAVVGVGAMPGWSRYIASNPELQYTVGRWFLLKSILVSGGNYMYTADPTAMAVLPLRAQVFVFAMWLSRCSVSLKYMLIARSLPWLTVTAPAPPS